MPSFKSTKILQLIDFFTIN